MLLGDQPCRCHRSSLDLQTAVWEQFQQLGIPRPQNLQTLICAIIREQVRDHDSSCVSGVRPRSRAPSLRKIVKKKNLSPCPSYRISTPLYFYQCQPIPMLLGNKHCSLSAVCSQPGPGCVAAFPTTLGSESSLPSSAATPHILHCWFAGLLLLPQL